jgi:hypothetical protein
MSANHPDDGSVPPPPPERDLPAGRHLAHRERLMTMIAQQTTTGFPEPPPVPPRVSKLRWKLAAPALAALLAGGVAAAVAVTGGGELPAGFTTGPAVIAAPNAGTADGATQRLQQIALAAGGRTLGPVAADRFVYREMLVADVYTTNDGIGATKLHKRQDWQSPDGRRGWLIEAGETPVGGITLDSDVAPHLGAPSYNLLAKLPTEPDALLTLIRKETAGQGNGPDHEAFSTIGDLLNKGRLPDGLNAALYRAAAKIPGVLLVDDSVDASGRHGIAIARVDSTNGVRDEWILDRTDYTLLGQRTVQISARGDMPAGIVTHNSALLRTAVVGSLKQVP